ncbi:NCP1 [Coprinopsis cinerea okayama7|uniref:NCP1 n=1 Tax=Coprinopsis cinerea (strain Okayama-7 / 130 / ATCC MYA-4618 / FGSC 9003) TaxID=240176 RepID=A8P299_COPC7|nr:NCP1 [Coprinopsis cinerea okayama7\|eukprot:XP_001838269.1 NCP1 [Coprinopsis cinerea okayama7\
MEYDSFDAILHYIFRSTQGDAWFKPSEENVSAGVCIRVEPGHYRVFPYENPFLTPFEAAVRELNPLIATKVRSAAVHSALATVSEDSTAIYIDANTRIQILDTVSHLARADKEQCGAFLRDERVLVVWCDDLDQIIPLCTEFNEKIMKLVWRTRMMHTSSIFTSRSSLPVPSIGSSAHINEKAPDIIPTVGTTKPVEPEQPPPPPRKWYSWKLSRSKPTSATQSSDPEKGDDRQERPVRLFAPFYAGLGFGLSVFFVASGLAIVLQEFRLDGDFTRFALLVTFPFLVCVALFFALQIIANVSFCIGPVAQYHENSKYYSAIKPAPNDEVDSKLPHITVELPVYKESLEDTIAPSVYSLKKAMQTYARQGGTSAIFVHDDGLQLLDEAEREKRIAFYADHNIGWVARPPHSNDPDGFQRAGRFKKASNMNYGLQLSLCMEKHIMALEASGEKFDDPFQPLEERALELAVEEIYEQSGKRWKPWACNARSLRIGDIILLVDSDTIVPEDCFRDAARELHECPEVAIIQHESDVMQVAHHYFENGIAYFTRRINKCISMGCANGEVAPFVGHNAFLRWSALQEASFVDPDDGVTKVWSESNVSEDFDMALRLQLKNYIIRWATYSEGGFKEGVSLTCDDELNRWQKYSYGCSELIFNPIIRWWRLGPITKQLRVFLWSSAPVHYKITMMSYMFSYYGLAGSFLLSVINYLMLGLALEVDGFYMHSFEIFLACTVVFPGLGNVGYTLLEYRLGHKDLLRGLFENLIWVPFFFFFFGGLSIHISVAILAHLFSYNITWGATKKEVERSNFWKEVPKILKRFRVALIICAIVTIAMIVLATPLVPLAYRIPIYSWAVVLPLAIAIAGHVLYPVVLNPWLMIFSY